MTATKSEKRGHTTSKMTNLEAGKEFLKWKESIGQSTGTVNNDSHRLSAWLRESNLGEKSPAYPTERHISDWLNDPDRDAKAATRHNQLATLSNYFQYCVAKGYRNDNPAALVRINLKSLTHEQKEKEVREPFTPVEYSKLVTGIRAELKTLEKEISSMDRKREAAGTDPIEARGLERKAVELREKVNHLMFWLFATMLAWETGLRLADIACLEWESFNGNAVWTRKRGQRVEFDISPEIEDMVTQIPLESSRYMFPDQRKIATDIKKRASLSMQFMRLCKQFGIEDRSFHSLRHSAATEADQHSGKEALAAKLAEALTEDQIRQLLGHADRKTTKRYIHKR